MLYNRPIGYLPSAVNLVVSTSGHYTIFFQSGAPLPLFFHSRVLAGKFRAPPGTDGEKSKGVLGKAGMVAVARM